MGKLVHVLRGHVEKGWTWWTTLEAVNESAC